MALDPDGDTLTYSATGQDGFQYSITSDGKEKGTGYIILDGCVGAG